jgi:hypothetical protein
MNVATLQGRLLDKKRLALGGFRPRKPRVNKPKLSKQASKHSNIEFNQVCKLIPVRCLTWLSIDETARKEMGFIKMCRDCALDTNGFKPELKKVAVPNGTN